MIGLVMIVRDEAHGIATTLASVRDTVSRWTVLDTGSTDGTQNVVRETMRDVPGELHEGPFGDFATARNRVLDLAGERTPWVLMLDADDRVEGAQALLAAATSAQAGDGALLVRRQIGPTSWWAPLLLRSSARWRYHGRVHEYACGPGGQHATRRVGDALVRHERPPQSEVAVRARWQRDVALLDAELAEGRDVPRQLFYLGQTHECLGQLDRAAGYYERRIAAGGWRPEIVEAHLRRARCLRGLGRPDQAVVALLAAHGVAPERAEPLVELASHFRGAGNHEASYLFAQRAVALDVPRDGYFLDDAAWDVRRWDEFAVAAYYVGTRRGDASVLRAGADAARRALAQRPGDERLRRNLGFFASIAA